MALYKCNSCGVEILTTKDVGEVYRPNQQEKEKVDAGRMVLLYTPLKPVNCLKCGKRL